MERIFPEITMDVGQWHISFHVSRSNAAHCKHCKRNFTNGEIIARVTMGNVGENMHFDCARKLMLWLIETRRTGEKRKEMKVNE